MEHFHVMLFDPDPEFVRGVVAKEVVKGSEPLAKEPELITKVPEPEHLEKVPESEHLVKVHEPEHPENAPDTNGRDAMEE